MTMFARNRSLSHKTFFLNAQSIYVEASKIAHNENVVPKSHRFTFGVPMCDTARSIIANIERASAFYPNTPTGVAKRKEYFGLAIASAETLFDIIACLIEERGGPSIYKTEEEEFKEKLRECSVNVNRLARLLFLLNDEITLLQAVRKRVRLI